MKRIAVLLFFVVLLAGTALAADPPTGQWHPEITERPRLLFGPGDLTELQDRVTREPYTTLMNRVLSRSNAGYNSTIPDPYNASREYGNANIAKAAAFVAWMENDADKADKAASIIEVMGVDFGSPLVPIEQDIHMAEALMNYCVAYDILAGTGLIDPTRLQGLADNIGTFVENLYRDFFDLLAIYQIFSFSNHSTKINSALAMAGMTLNEREDSNKWFNLGFCDNYHKMFDINITDGGAYVEGPYYGTYSADQHLPVFLMYDRLIGQDATLLRRGLCLIGPNCPWKEYDIINPLDHPKLREMSEWYVKLRMPHGGYGPVDDANIEGFFNGLLVGPWQDGMLAWDWIENPAFPMFAIHCGDLNVDMIAFYDDSVTITSPDEVDFGPNFIMPDAGQAVFRSGWEEADTWMMMIAENGLARKGGFGHEHPDNLSVSLYAREQYLLIDPGYIAWEHHLVVNKGRHHNLPSVDGRGPEGPGAINYFPGTDAFFVDGAVDSVVPFARGVSTYRNTDVNRVVFFPDSDYMIVVDELKSAEPHQFGVFWHGHAGGDSGYPFTLLADGGTWEREGAAVDVHVATNAGDLELATTVNIHGFSWMQQEEHTSLNASAENQTTHARFISVATPYEVTTEEPPLVWQSRGEGDIVSTLVLGGDLPIYTMARNFPALVSLDADDTESLDVTTDATTLLLSSDEYGSEGYVYAQGGMHLELSDVRTWSFGADESFWAEWTGEIWDLHFSPDGNIIRTPCVSEPGVVADPGVDYDYDDGWLTIWSDEEAWARVTFAWNDAPTTRLRR